MPGAAYLVRASYRSCCKTGTSYSTDTHRNESVDCCDCSFNIFGLFVCFCWRSCMYVRGIRIWYLVPVSVYDTWYDIGQNTAEYFLFQVQNSERQYIFFKFQRNEIWAHIYSQVDIHGSTLRTSHTKQGRISYIVAVVLRLWTHVHHKHKWKSADHTVDEIHAHSKSISKRCRPQEEEYTRFGHYVRTCLIWWHERSKTIRR